MVQTRVTLSVNHQGFKFLPNKLLELLAIPVTDYKTLRESLMLDKLEALAREIGAMTQEELERWRRSLESAAAEGTFFASATQVMVAGCKP